MTTWFDGQDPQVNIDDLVLLVRKVRHTPAGNNYTPHDYMGDNFTGHNSIGHNCIGHKYVGHNYTDHNYIGTSVALSNVPHECVIEVCS